MRDRLLALSLLLAWIAPSPTVLAQAPTPPSGHWKGSIQVPGQPLDIEIDLAKGAAEWEGTISIPVQGLKGFPISAIAVQGDTVSFTMKGVPGDPTFTGKVSSDAKSITGDFSQGGGTVPFTLARTGDATIEAPPKSTPITKDIEGSWEGGLDVNGKILRLVLKLSNGADKGGTGTLISVDQGGGEIPLTAVMQTGSHVKVVIRSIAGSYEGDLKDGQLIGTWTQGPGNLPLVFKRPVK
jgi:hypothetical protein